MHLYIGSPVPLPPARRKLRRGPALPGAVTQGPRRRAPSVLDADDLHGALRLSPKHEPRRHHRERLGRYRNQTLTPMRTEHYTPDTICHCIGVPGFETDPDLAVAGESIRLLLQPSFHPEVCITFSRGPDQATVSVIAARAMVWHQPSPTRVPTGRDRGDVSTDCFASHAAALAAASSRDEAALIIDGMPVDALLVQDGRSVLKVRRNAGCQSTFGACVAQVISTAWNSLQDIPCRNALAHAARYTGLDLPLFPEAAGKPSIQTLILGADAERRELLDALKQHHGG